MARNSNSTRFAFTMAVTAGMAAGWANAQDDSNASAVWNELAQARDTSASVAKTTRQLDMNGDGKVDKKDLREFFEAYAEARPIADFNGDKVQNYDDVELFIQSYTQAQPSQPRPDGSTAADKTLRDLLSYRCPADFNLDLALDFYDVAGFVQSFQERSPDADLNGDSIVDYFDLMDFFQAYQSGCIVPRPIDPTESGSVSRPGLHPDSATLETYFGAVAERRPWTDMNGDGVWSMPDLIIFIEHVARPSLRP